MTRRWALVLGVLFAGCEASPEEIAAQYVVACEHGHPRQAYALLSQGDRDVRAFRDFKKQRVRSIDDRIDRLLARRTKVQGRLLESDGRNAKVAVEMTKVDLDGNARKLIADDLEKNGPGIVSRLQRMQLPVLTSSAAVNLVREAGGWRVFLDLATHDRLASARRLAVLKRKARHRVQQGRLAWARALYEQAAEVAPTDRQVRHALDGLRAMQADRFTERAALDYRARVVVRAVRVDGRAVSGELRNLGGRDLDEVEVLVVGLDARGAPIVEVSAMPVRSGADQRLLAGRTVRFTATLPRPPPTWTRQVDVRVVGVRFSR